MTERFAEAFGTDPLCKLVVIERRIKVPPSELVLSKDGEAGWVAMNCGENCCLLFAKSANATERFVEKELDLGRYYDRERSRVTAGPIKSEFAPAFKVWAERWGVPIRETQGTIFQYTLSECPAECPKDFEIKPGMKGIIRDARLEDAEAIGRHWDHGCGASSSTTVRLLREIIMNGNPGTVIEIDGTPAAWGLQNECGFVAFAHTLPQYRGMGLGKAVIRDLTRKIIKRGDAGMCFVVQGNTASASMLRSCGYTEIASGTSYSYIGFYDVPITKINRTQNQFE